MKNTFLTSLALFIINTLIYALALYIELKYLYTVAFYQESIGSRFGNEFEFRSFLSIEKSFDIINYLWLPIHVLGIASFTTLCIFLGFNIMNVRIGISKTFNISLKASIILSLNYLLSVLLKLYKIVDYNYSTIDDVYFYQSIGRLFVRYDWPSWAYAILGRFNIAELVFYIILSLIIAYEAKIKVKDSLYYTGISYGVGLCFLGIVITFTGFII